MPASLTRIWIHAFFSTRNRLSLITPNVAEELRTHMWQRLEHELRCPVRAITLCPDHAHILFHLNPIYSLGFVLQFIKGESSHWINERDVLPAKFVWERGYFACSVSDENLGTLEHYLLGKTGSHQAKTYLEECLEFPVFDQQETPAPLQPS